MSGNERKVAAVIVLACIGLLAYGAQAERPERDVARYDPAAFNVWHGDIRQGIGVFGSRGRRYYRERYFYRHGKSNFIRRRHRSFVYYPEWGHCRYCCVHGRHRYYRGRPSYGGRHGYRHHRR